MPSSYVIPVTEAAPSERLSFVSIINFVLRNIPWLLLGGMVFAVLLTLPSATRAPSYTASTAFVIEGEPAVGRFMGFGGGGGRGPEYYIGLLKTPLFLEPLIQQPIEIAPGQPQKTLLDLYGGSGPLQDRRERAMDAVDSRLRAKPSEIGIVTLDVTAENPQLAAAMAEAILNQIHEFINSQRRVRTSEERKFIEQRMAEVDGEVRAAENRLQDFLERNRDVGRSPALQMEKDRLSEFLGAKRALYSSIMQAHEKARIDEVREAPRATVVSRALPPTSPDSRHILRNLVLGFFAGMVFASFAALTREYLARIPTQSTPEAEEYAHLRASLGHRLRRPLERVSRGPNGKKNL